MPAYRFQAADAAGVLHRGIVDADSSRQARAIIRERGQTPIEVVALSATSTWAAASRMPTWRCVPASSPAC